MSALAHYLEYEGLATVVVSLVRAQSDAVNPPRTLWVPFELGRPLGEPGDAPFQRAVLKAALALLDEPRGPLTREFEVDAPGMRDDPRWTPPALDGAADVAGELAALAAAHTAFVRDTGRTTACLSGLTPGQAAAYVAGFPGAASPAPLPGLSALMQLRFAADDLKAHYLEAASATGGRPSSRQLQDWLWRSTRLGALLAALRERATAGTDGKFERLADRFLIPRNYR